MKKIICLLVIVVVLIFAKGNDYYIVPSDAIRFRIIPNSNSYKDIMMKETVQYEINDVIKKIETKDINETREKILSNINELEKRIDVLFEVNNYDKDYKINFGINHFPEKIYKGVKYPEGDYESLVVEIGAAKGNNFWCVLYPPLCMIDKTTEKQEYKFKVIEIFKKILNK